MSKKKKSQPVQMKHKDCWKGGKLHIGTISAEDIRKATKPRQMPTSGFGVHGDTKYNRRKQKAADRKIINEDL